MKRSTKALCPSSVGQLGVGSGDWGRLWNGQPLGYTRYMSCIYRCRNGESRYFLFVDSLDITISSPGA